MKIACLGDSITYYGSPATAVPFPQRLQLLLDAGAPGASFVANHGVHSDKVTVGFGTRYTSDIAGKGYTGLVFLGGINDVSTDVSAAAIEAAAQTILDAARAASMAVVIIGMSPFGSDAGDYTAPRETVRTNVNSWLAAYAATNSLPFINTDALLGNGASPPALQAQYDYDDGLHWTQAAVDLIAPLLKTALGL